MRLADGTLWPIPITLDVTEEFASSIQRGSRPLDGEGPVWAGFPVGMRWGGNRFGYDSVRDLLYIWFGSPGTKAARIETVEPGVHADFDRRGVLGIEVLDALSGHLLCPPAGGHRCPCGRLPLP